MNRLAIRKECRRFLDDTAQPYEIADDALNERIDEAIREACVRANLIIDSTTASTCQISVSAGTNEYTLSPLVLDVNRASLPSAAKPLIKLGYKALDDDDGQWQTRTGVPSRYILNMDTNKLQLFPVPIEDETLALTVSRLPLDDLVDDNSIPPIKSEYHFDLVYWVLHLTYLTRDSEIFDKSASDRFELKFERRFGPRKTAAEIEGNLRSYRRRSKPQWF